MRCVIVDDEKYVKLDDILKLLERERDIAKKKSEQTYMTVNDIIIQRKRVDFLTTLICQVRAEAVSKTDI